MIETATRAARAAGKLLLEMQAGITVREKGPKDLVTEADLAAQEVIRDILLGEFPSHEFVGEEDNLPPMPAHSSGSRCRWIVDPLDGTTNYVHRLQTFAVSIAVECGGVMQAGVVFDPVMDECYTAVAGEGAFLNGERIGTSSCNSLEKCLAAASFSTELNPQSPEIARFVRMLIECRAVRRLGSAALNLCYVAAGRLDAYWATSVKPWDVAAGVLMVQEAGGMVSHIHGDEYLVTDPRFAAASTVELHQAMMPVLNPPETGDATD